MDILHLMLTARHAVFQRLIHCITPRGIIAQVQRRQRRHPLADHFSVDHAFLRGHRQAALEQFLIDPARAVDVERCQQRAFRLELLEPDTPRNRHRLDGVARAKFRYRARRPQALDFSPTLRCADDAMVPRLVIFAGATDIDR